MKQVTLASHFVTALSLTAGSVSARAHHPRSALASSRAESATAPALAAAAGGIASSSSGIASFYGGNLAGGNCMFTSYTLPSGLFGTALAGPNWDSAGLCGACLSVTGPKGTIKVMVVDQCPGCEANQLDLFENAFPSIGDPTAGTVDISWDVVPCGISTPLSVRNKEGTSQYYFSMQVLNANEPVTALDVSTDGGATWHSTVRQDYNFFQEAGTGGFGAQSMTVRVSCANGKQVTINSVGTAANAEFKASGNC